MGRPKAVLTMVATKLAKRGRTKGTVTVRVLGTVTQSEDGRTRIDTAPLAVDNVVSVEDLIAVCEREGHSPVIALAEGINLLMIRDAMLETRKTPIVRLKIGELKDRLLVSKLTDDDKVARRAARDIADLARLLKIPAEKIAETVTKAYHH